MRLAKCFVLMLATSALACRGKIPTADPLDVRSASPIASGSAGGAALAVLGDAAFVPSADGAALAVLEEAGIVPSGHHPCPKGIDHCIFVMEQKFYRGTSYLHEVWIMDTTGREYDLRFYKAEDDPLRDLGATSITQTEFEQAVTRVKAPSRSVTAAEVARALSLLALSLTGAVEALPRRGCSDGVGTRINGFWFDEDQGNFSSIFLRSEACGCIQKENSSPAARMLAQWIDGVRRKRSPCR